MQSLDTRGEVTEAHVADGVGILGDNLLNRAVGSLKQGLGHDLGLLHDHFFPRFVGTGGRVAGHDHDVGVGAAQFLPIGDLAGVDVLELVEAEFVDRVFGIHDRNKRVDRDGGTDGIDALLGGQFLFTALDVAGRHGDVGQPVEQGLDAVAGTAAGKRDLHVGISRHVGFGHLLHNGQHGGGAVDDDFVGSLRLSGQKAGQGQKGSQDNAFHLHELRFFGL